MSLDSRNAILVMCIISIQTIRDNPNGKGYLQQLTFDFPWQRAEFILVYFVKNTITIHSYDLLMTLRHYFDVMQHQVTSFFIFF